LAVRNGVEINTVKMKVFYIVLFLFILYAVYKLVAPTNFKNITVGEINKIMEENPDVVLLDVRTPKETANGKIKNAKEIDVLDASFSTKIKQLDKSKPYLVYCRSGGRSVKACNILFKNGFEDLYNLKGGYNAWSRVNK
jgi:rhodanese-related sulfurtransferase